MSKFHDYSIGNLILIMLQKQEATRVAGFSTWKDLGRWVKKGEKGIAILAPCLRPKGTQPSPTENSESENEGREEQEEIRPLYFKVVYVFDVSQTEGKPLPEFEVPPLTGEANEELFNEVMQLVQAQEVKISFEPRPDQDPDIKGMYFAKTIWVRPEESRAQQLKTLIHEVAHYYTEGVFRIPRQDAETIAESVAFTIGAHFGFDTGTRSFPYVAIWSKDKKVLEANLASIRKVSAKIFDGLEQTANKTVGVALLDRFQGSPAARLLEKWRTAKARNSALAMKDLEALGLDYDTEDSKQALIDYREIEPGDYSDREEYQEAREEAWDAFIECLESLAGEEEETTNSISQSGAR
jgi:putative lipoic acid-binding regulatory protein